MSSPKQSHGSTTFRDRVPMVAGPRALMSGTHVIHPPTTRWGYVDLALCGALVGALPMLAFNLLDVLSGHFDASDPFLHVMAETIGAAGVGAILCVILSLIYRSYVQRM